METYQASKFAGAIGADVEFLQENQSLSLKKDTVRGLHFQGPPKAQGKLVRVLNGSALDVAVDIRRGSPNYGRSVSLELSAENDHQLWIPAGFMHGFRTLRDNTIISYRCTNVYAPEYEGAILWNDPSLNIDWGIEDPVVMSERDLAAPLFADFESPFIYDPQS